MDLFILFEHPILSNSPSIINYLFLMLICLHTLMTLYNNCTLITLPQTRILKDYIKLYLFLRYLVLLNEIFFVFNEIIAFIDILTPY